MVKTFKNILNDIEVFSKNHLQINSFGWGNPNNISTKEHDFVLLWLTPVSCIIEGGLMVLRFNMYVMDVVKQDFSNLKDVMNDTLLIGNDVISKFWSNEETYEWSLNEKNVRSEPFEAKFDDYCAGWIFSIDIEIENRLNNCIIPELN